MARCDADLGCGKAAVDAGSGDAQGAGDLGARGARFVEGLDRGGGVRGETWAAWVAAGGACCGDSGGSAFGGDGSLELGDGAEDVEDESSAGCGGVNGLCE